MSEAQNLGQLTPIGGGDPIPLKKTELVIGRRPSSDIRLDFENVSGRHCQLHFHHGVWNVRDLGSTNGTRINGNKLQREQAIMPDDELAIASHLFTVDYEPAASVAESHQVLEEETESAKGPTSLMELAGFSNDGSPQTQPKSKGRFRARSKENKPEPRPAPPPGENEVKDDFNNRVPPEFEETSKSSEPEDDEDFFKIIEEDLMNRKD